MTVKKYLPAVPALWPFAVRAPHQPRYVLTEPSCDSPKVYSKSQGIIKDGAHSTLHPPVMEAFSLYT